ncbi:MAG: 2OG-Fe(II) oxygenase [Balneolaceae bacterium]|nr:2OG-Fe(II) oxygenase [Balneolaceae bacterium]
MDKLKKEISDCLQNLKGSGKFASVNTTGFVLPGLNIEGAGEISFPVNEMQAERLIQSAKKAPFGKGSETLLDTDVRNTWEIDAEKLHFDNPVWQDFLNDIIENVQIDLGIEDYSMKANLYKLLIYEEGGFFLKHKDSEKEKGMFGTLILSLPSKFSGGELVIEFEKEQVVADFSRAGLYKTGYAAFYADCDHEVKPLKSGYRICLVYNLIQEEAGKSIELSSIQNYSDRIVESIKNHEANHPKENYIILLGHQYTPENFSFDQLKLNDRLKAEVLLRAAETLGYYGKMCLVTSYLAGTPEYDGYYALVSLRSRMHLESGSKCPNAAVAGCRNSTELD